MLQKENHTPWDFFINDGEWEVFDAHGHIVASNLTEANARLIAVAPELLEALKLGLEYWQDRQQRYSNRSPVWVQKARAAITKTTGV